MLPLKVPSLYSSLLTVLYDPKAFVTHAALLRQAFAHCARFPTAASRRSLGRVSVPVWLIILSDQLSIFDLVELLPHQLSNGPRADRKAHKALTPRTSVPVVLSGISSPFGGLFLTLRYVTHVLLTRAPLYSQTEVCFLARLACVKHAANVRSEPGSNSPI